MDTLILCTSQFGYHLDTYYYCKYGREVLDITYVGFAGTREAVEMGGIRVKNVAYHGGKVRRFIRWWWAALRESRKDYDVVFVKYFPGCSLIRLLMPRKTFVLDIRTGAVASSRWRRRLLDALLRWETLFFSNVTVISASLAKKLGLRGERVHLLPLGADPVPTRPKQFDRLDLLYVGTLSGRDLEKTIRGFARFHQAHGNEVATTFSLVGDGHNKEREHLRRLAVELGVGDIVSLRGFIHHSSLAEYWERCNVGVSFVPINDIYDVQPPTKTFECILAGMPVIATNTMENRCIVQKDNGVLIDDSADGFRRGLEEILRRRARYDSAAIRATCADYHWEKIVRGNLCPYVAEVAGRILV